MSDQDVLGRVLVYTMGLCLVVVVLATSITGVVFRLSGLEAAGLGQVMLFCAIMCVVLSPLVLGPLVWTTLRLRQISTRLRDAALTDALTGAPNRRAFFERLASRLENGREPARFALLMLDVDRFKALNDRLGHEAGDAALVHVVRELGRSLAAVAPPGTMLARIGGEEFAVFLDGADLAVATRVAGAACAHLRATAFVHRSEAIFITVSIGVWSGTAGSGDVALALADRAAYAAKAKGRDCWEVATDEAATLPDVAA